MDPFEQIEQVTRVTRGYAEALDRLNDLALDAEEAHTAAKALEAHWRRKLDYLEAQHTQLYADVRPESVRDARIRLACEDDPDYIDALTELRQAVAEGNGAHARLQYALRSFGANLQLLRTATALVTGRGASPP